MNSISVVIPTYNEKKRLPRTLENVVQFLSENFPGRSEIIISDGGSNDGTVEYVNEFRSLVPIKLVSQKIREGKGAGVKKGMLHASRDFVLFMDADNSTNISQLKKLDQFTDEYQVIIGSRYAGKEITVKQSFARRIVSRVGHFIIKILTKLDINDTQCGFKLFSNRAVKTIFPRQQSKGWGFDVEILMLAQKMGFEIKEVPVVWRDTEGSHLRGVGALFATFSEVVNIAKNVRSLKLEDYEKNSN